MAIAVKTGQKIVLRYTKGSYTFDKIKFDSSDTQMHGLALALNAFQTEEPVKIVKVITSQIA